MLTPEDIEQKTFSTALRGYDLNEVDDFLDEIMATIRDLTEKLEAAKAGQPMAEPSAVATAAPVAATAPAIDESAVGRALVAAQEAADRIRSEAEAEADRIKDEARQEADSWVTERAQARADAEKEMTDLSNRVASVRRELAVLAAGVADGLDQMDATIAGTEPVARHTSISEADGEDASWDEYMLEEDDESASDGPDDSVDELEEEEASDDEAASADSVDSESVDSANDPDGSVDDDDSEDDAGSGFRY